MAKDSWLSEYLYIFGKNKTAVAGTVLVVLFLFCAVAAPLLAPHNPNQQYLEHKKTPPIWSEGGKWTYPLGTDDLGRDMLSRLIYGAQYSMLIGGVAVGVALLFGLIFGTLAGYYGGWLDGFLMMIVNILLSLPAILLAIVIVAILGPSLTNAIIAIGLVKIPVYTRLVRASVMEEKEKEYVMASRLCGTGSGLLMFTVILPNCLGPVIVQSTMGFASAVLEAAGLSFLGLGAQPPTPEWGAMLNDALQFLFTAPWIVILPGLAIFFTVTGFNLMGDGLMDVLDPKAKGR